MGWLRLVINTLRRCLACLGVMHGGLGLALWCLGVQEKDQGDASTPRRGMPRLGVGKLKKGSLQIKKQNLEAKQSKAPRICVDEHAYACCSYPNPGLSQPTTLRRGNLLDQSHAYAWEAHAYAWIVTLSTSMVTLPQP
ncbi:hypothetical protein PIB30_102597 [Stylosanthes scabra]|uniref:Uncharacterized protein n=1 Tax=Stylosanthes scabra TaxID=79078 RepID=A0ABU6ZX11_9FABA|nr:hypothetical protein [Stylosanthes scabra]